MDQIVKCAGEIFANDPEKAVRMLLEGRVIKADVASVASFLYTNEARWNTANIWRFVASNVGWNMPFHFARCCEMSGVPIDEALRTVLLKCNPTGSTLAELDIMLFAVARAHYGTNPPKSKQSFSGECEAESFCFACLLLSFLLHPPQPSQSFPRPITKPRFVKGCSALDLLLDDAMSGEAFDRILAHPLTPTFALAASEYVDQVDSPAVHRQAWLSMDIGGRWRRCWARVGEAGLVVARTPRLFGFDEEILVHIPLSGMMVIQGGTEAASDFGFVVQGTLKSRAGGQPGDGDETEDGDRYTKVMCRAKSEEEKEEWVDAIIAVSQASLIFTGLAMVRDRFLALPARKETGGHGVDTGLGQADVLGEGCAESRRLVQPEEEREALVSGRRQGSGGGKFGAGGGDLVRHLEWQMACLKSECAAVLQRALLEQAGRAVVDGLRTHIRALRGTRMSWMQRVRQTAETRVAFVAWSYAGWARSKKEKSVATSRSKRSTRLGDAVARGRTDALLSFAMTGWRIETLKARAARPLVAVGVADARKDLGGNERSGPPPTMLPPLSTAAGVGNGAAKPGVAAVRTVDVSGVHPRVDQDRNQGGVVGVGRLSARTNPASGVAHKDRKRLLSRCVTWWRWGGLDREDDGGGV